MKRIADKLLADFESPCILLVSWERERKREGNGEGERLEERRRGGGGERYEGRKSKEESGTPKGKQCVIWNKLARFFIIKRG